MKLPRLEGTWKDPGWKIRGSPMEKSEEFALCSVNQLVGETDIQWPASLRALQQGVSICQFRATYSEYTFWKEVESGLIFTDLSTSLSPCPPLDITGRGCGTSWLYNRESVAAWGGRWWHFLAASLARGSWQTRAAKTPWGGWVLFTCVAVF